MQRFVDWFLEVTADVLVGLAIYGLLRLVERRQGFEWAEVFQFIRSRNAPRYVPAPAPRWAP